LIEYTFDKAGEGGYDFLSDLTQGIVIYKIMFPDETPTNILLTWAERIERHDDGQPVTIEWHSLDEVFATEAMLGLTLITVGDVSDASHDVVEHILGESLNEYGDQPVPEWHPSNVGMGVENAR
jgi:hypothetical protein